MEFSPFISTASTIIYDNDNFLTFYINRLDKAKKEEKDSWKASSRHLEKVGSIKFPFLKN